MQKTQHLTDEDLLLLLSRGEESPHLRSCASCARRSRAIGDAMRDWPLPGAPLPASAWEGVARSVRRRPLPSRRRLPALVAALAALLLLATSGAFLWSHPPGGMQRLVGTARAPKAAARLLPLGGGALFFAWGLPPPPHREVYELWAIRGKRHIRAAVFRPDAFGRAILTIPAALLASSYGVTLEPSPGASHPSNRRVLHE